MRYAVVLLMAVLLLPACVADNNQVQNLQARLDLESQRVQELSRRMELLNQTVSGRGQANMVNEINTLRQEVARLNGKLEEAQNRGNFAATSAANASASISASDILVQNLERRMVYVERYLGIAGARPANTTSSPPAPASPAEPPSLEPTASAQAMFDAGVNLFKQKSYQAARDRFEQLLSVYPNHKLAEAAQFWLGETLFADRKFEEAILSYNQLVKRYPNSKNLLAAQLKQGLSFAELGDAQAAKIILNKIVAENPNSSEAKTAKERLGQLH